MIRKKTAVKKSTAKKKVAVKKPAIKKKVVKHKVPRTRNANTMTESMYWGMIRQALRNKSRFWKPKMNAKQKARRPYTGPNKRQKFEYQCAICTKWFPEKNIEMDHLIEAGALNCSADLPAFVDNLFCEESGYQCVCKPCHKIKSQAYLAAKKKLKNKI